MARRFGRSASVLAVFAIVAGGLPGLVGAASPTPIPVHVYSPYFETWTTDSIGGVAAASGARYLTLAFLETTSKTSCTLAWDGVRTDPIGTTTKYVGDVASLQASGGDVVPSFGGWSADQGGTEIGDSCKDVSVIAAAYEQVVTKYNVTRLDMDIEGRSLSKTDGINRRNQAIRLLQDWAAAQGRPLTISYTLPTSATGLEASGQAVIQSAETAGVRNFIIQPMVFDYYDHVTTDMGSAAINAVTGAKTYLRSLEPGLNEAKAWARIGATIMNGIDDYPKKTEVTTLAHATQLFNFAKDPAHHMAVLSMWAIQRDNGGCPGVGGANDCSGIVQNAWDFSHIFEPFTSTAP